MKNISIVEKIEQDYVTVSTARHGACGENCAACNCCTVERVMSKATCDFDVKVGDVVLIESDTFSVIVTLFSIFILPLILPLIFYAIAKVIGMFFGIGLAGVIIYFLSRSKLLFKKITPKIISVVNKI